MCLKEYEIPQRGLHGGKVYEMVDHFKCPCGWQEVISVSGTVGRTALVGCPTCNVWAHKTPLGWYKAYRFVPINDPDFVDVEERETIHA